MIRVEIIIALWKSASLRGFLNWNSYTYHSQRPTKFDASDVAWAVRDPRTF